MMIPSPGKRRHQQQDQSMTTTINSNTAQEAEEEEADERMLLFNGLVHSEPGEDECEPGNGEEEDDELIGEEAEVIEGDEDEFEYLRLDTIVEEDENSELDSNCADNELNQLAGDSTDSECDRKALSRSRHRRHSTGEPQQSGALTAPAPKSQVSSAGVSVISSTGRPLAEQLASSQSNSMRKFTTTTTTTLQRQQQQLAENNNMMENNNNNNKCDTKQQQAAKCNHITNQPLPSTNRLISEHQVRQQQSLFKALAQRQRLMDELGADERDLMSASFSSLGNINLGHHLSGSNQDASNEDASQRQQVHRRRRRRRCRKSQKPSETAGVPLSAVDLSSMSDRMLDELLGHIASASSSSLSSNGESLDSSDLSDAASSDNSDCEPDSGGRRPAESRLQAPSTNRKESRNDAPNVVGVHEDERQRQAHRRTCDNQRQAEDSHGDEDDDDQADHELVVQLKPAPGTGGVESLSPPPANQAHHHHHHHHRQQPPDSQRLHPQDHQLLQPPQQQQQPTRRNKLEDYFTSNLVSPHDYATVGQTLPEPELAATPTRAGESVEEVLARMLEALQEINVSEEAGEQLNELLERGFAHLEQLLQCNLGPSGGGGGAGPGAFPAASGYRGVGGRPAGLIGGKTSSALSKDSDYGSDTQSADCLSQCADNAASGIHLGSSQPAATDSPSPTSLATTSSGHSACGMGVAKLGGLSPLAVELSFKLAESLHRLAQQQAARRAAAESVAAVPQPLAPVAPRKTPMKSVVLINSSNGGGTTRPASADSLGSSSGRTPQRNVTPESGGDAKPRAHFKTCVNIGGGGAAVSNVTVLARDKDLQQQQRRQDSSEKQADLSSSSSKSSSSGGDHRKKQQEREDEEEEERREVSVVGTEPQVEPQVQLPQQQLERRRSSRASLRRRPSFSGSASSLHMPSGAARPGSPLPRPLGEDPGAGEQVVVAAAAAGASGAKQRQQLQRALVLAQKYNYSPAKLAASKLSSKLQLKELTRQQQQQQVAEQHYSDSMAINGTQTLKPTIGREDPSWSKTGAGQQPIRVSGQVQLDISYFAKSGSLSVHVLQCTQLAPVSKRRTTSNPYVKLYLLPDRTKSGKRKSAILRSQLDPKFDESFTFGPLALADFDQKTLWLSVWHKDRLGRNEFLGEIFLPLSQVRQQLLNSDTCQSIATQWYPLRERFDASDSYKQQAQRQLPHCQDTANKLPATKNTTGTSTSRRQVEPLAADKLSELQRKAVRLTSAVAPPVGSPITELAMNVTLGSAPQPHLAATITGQLFVALKFAPDYQQEHLSASRAAHASGALQVIIKEAHNIGGFEAPTLITGRLPTSGGQPPPSGPLPNPFCKCYLLASSGQRLAKQKTASMKRTANPKWEHKCIFGQLKLSQLASQAIEIQMFNRDSILVSNNEYLGGIRLCSQVSNNNNNNNSSTSSADDTTSQQSGDSLRRSAATAAGVGNAAVITAADIPEEGALCSEREARLWSQMLARPNIWVYGELRLRQLRPLVPIGSNSATSKKHPPIVSAPAANLAANTANGHSLAN